MGVYFKSPPLIRRHVFRYAQCARQTFLCGGSSARRTHEGLLTNTAYLPGQRSKCANLPKNILLLNQLLPSHPQGFPYLFHGLNLRFRHTGLNQGKAGSGNPGSVCQFLLGHAPDSPFSLNTSHHKYSSHSIGSPSSMVNTKLPFSQCP